MPNPPEVNAFSSTINEYLSVTVFFFLGLWVVIAYAWQRFNQPSFPNQDTLPRAVEPLQYLFLKPTYRKARFTYVGGFLLLYGILVAPGSSILSAMGGVYKDFPPQAWALLVALFLVGLAPNSVQWLNIIEEQLRRWVHAWFLVPDGVERTVAVLEDADYNPPERQLNFIQGPRRERVQDDLKLPTATLRCRWARATILVTSLKYMRGGAEHPLQRAAFEPFKQDFDALLEKFRALKPDVEAILEQQRALKSDVEVVTGDPSNGAGEGLDEAVDSLLKRIYAYISWGVRHQANSERDVDQKLDELGFCVPRIGGRHHLFDIVIPTVLLVSPIMVVFWVVRDAVAWALSTADSTTMSESVIAALTSGMAASLMYGFAVTIALRRRSAQIERKSWREGSTKCLIQIALIAGLVTWGVIVVSTVYWRLPEAWQSLIGLVQPVKLPPVDASVSAIIPLDRAFLPLKVATALPWLLVGATASVVLALRLHGDVRRIDITHRIRDAMFLAVALCAAAAAAQFIQTCFVDLFHIRGWWHDVAPSLSLVPIDGLAEFICGAVIGFMVPQAYRANLVTPPDPAMARALRDLLRQAKTALGSKAAAEDWVFMPNDDLGGITPAEAIQYKSYATGVGRLLENEAHCRREEARFDRLAPVLIEGGRGADAPAATPARIDERIGA